MTPLPDRSEFPKLRAWQAEALAAWRASDSRGIVVAATGTGKTRIALEALSDMLDRGGRVAIVVPTIALQDQWFDQLRYKLLIGPGVLGTMGGASASFSLNQRVVLCVLSSAAQKLPGILQHWSGEGHEVLLIVDECHRLGSPQSKGLLVAHATSALGLSATPQRDDGRFEEQIERGLGSVVYELPLKRALDEGLLAPLRLLDVYFDLPASEVHDFKIRSERATGLQQTLSIRYPALRNEFAPIMQIVEELSTRDKDAKRLLALMRDNHRLVANSKARRALFTSILETGITDGRRSIIFNETIDQAEHSFATLKGRASGVVMDHSKLPSEQRARAHRNFATGLASTLVAVRTVDEGIDVPEASLAFIVSGTLTKRQRVQRLGRVLRPSGGVASVVSLLARGTTEEFSVGMEDPDVVGPDRVRFHDGVPGDEEMQWLLGVDAHMS